MPRYGIGWEALRPFTGEGARRRLRARAQRAAPAPRNRYATPSQDRLHRKHALPCARASRSARPRQNLAMTDKPFAPACERNREPILAVLREHFAGSRHVLEVGSGTGQRSEEHTSELQSLMRISYAVFCLKKKKKQNNT